MADKGHRELTIEALPESGLEAHARLVTDYLGAVRACLDENSTASLTVILAPAPAEHDAWRRALAGDLARQYTPKRVNIAAGEAGQSLDKLREYLRDAPGVTGHYVQAHD
jgi:hypothetical protein